MYPNAKPTLRRFNPGRKHQKGFLIPLSLFIVLGMGVLALSITRMGADTFASVTLESISVQALYAAESGAQYGAHQLLYNAASSTEVDVRCTNLNGVTVQFSVPGLNACSAQLQCVATGGSDGAAPVYSLQSAATCGSGSLIGERTIAVAVQF